MQKQSIYKFNAEHINRAAAIRLVMTLEDADDVVECADVGQTFTDELVMCVTCSPARSIEIRDIIWKTNGGASCDMEIITADQLDYYL